MINLDSTNSVLLNVQDTIKVIDSGSAYDSPNFYVSIVVAIVALIGLIIPFLHSFFSERQRQKSLFSYVLYILNELLKPIIEKATGLGKLSEEVSNIDSGNLAFKDSSTLLIEAFIKIDQKDLHQIFVVNWKDDEKLIQTQFKNIMDAVDYFDKQNEYDKQNFTQFFNDLRRYESSFNEAIDSIFRLYDLLLSYNKRENIKPSDDPFLNGFDKILYEWQQAENRDSMKIIKEILLNPLKEYCSKNSKDPRAVQTIPSIVKANSAYLNITTVRELYSGIFKETQETLLKKKSNLENALKFYS